MLKLASLGHVSLDGSKFKANSSKHKAMSYKHLKEKEAALTMTIDDLIKQAASCDTEEDATQLHFILRAKAVGFSLVDIAELLSIELEKSNWACADVKKVVDIKLTDIESKMMELSHFRSSLQQLSDACCGGQISAEHCSILESLESNGDNIRIEKPDHQHR